MGSVRKKKLYTEWQTHDTAIDDGKLVAIQKEVVIYAIYYANAKARGMFESKRETGNIRYEVIAAKEGAR